MSTADGIRVVGFEPRWRDDFATLNLEWLERWFVVEPYDRDVLEHPERDILARGGHILFAVDAANRALGTVALKHEGEGVYELTKMAVAPDAQAVVREMGAPLVPKRSASFSPTCPYISCSYSR